MLTAGHPLFLYSHRNPLIPPPKSLEKKKKNTQHTSCATPSAKVKVESCEPDGCLISTCCSAHTDQRVEAGVRHLSLHVSEFTAHNRFQQEGGGRVAVVCHPRAMQTAQHNVFIIGPTCRFLIRRDSACARQKKCFAGSAGSPSHQPMQVISHVAAKAAGNGECGGFLRSSG